MANARGQQKGWAVSRATAERQDSTVPTEWWTCHKCGNKVYLGLRHDCPTAPFIATYSPYDIGKIGQKEYPGE